MRKELLLLLMGGVFGFLAFQPAPDFESDFYNMQNKLDAFTDKVIAGGDSTTELNALKAAAETVEGWGDLETRVAEAWPVVPCSVGCVLTWRRCIHPDFYGESHCALEYKKCRQDCDANLKKTALVK